MSHEERLCALDEIEKNSARQFILGAHRIALIRIDDDLYAIGDRCTHGDVSLSEGEIDAETCHIECWKHGSRFDLRTGEPDSLPATKPVPTYEVRVDDGDVKVLLPS